MTYVAADDRYSKIPYRRSGRSGVLLPEISLGLWQNFGDGKPIEDQRAIIRRAFDLGVTHFAWPTTTALRTSALANCATIVTCAFCQLSG